MISNQIVQKMIKKVPDIGVEPFFPECSGFGKAEQIYSGMFGSLQATVRKAYRKGSGFLIVPDPECFFGNLKCSAFP